MRPDYYEDLRFCVACARYVNYLLAMDVAYCVVCGAKARLFSGADQKRYVGIRARLWNDRSVRDARPRARA